MKTKALIFVVLSGLVPFLLMGQEHGIHILKNPITAYYYYFDRNGKLLYRSMYDHPFSEGLAAVCNINEPEGKTGYIDTTGRMVIETSEFYITGFSDGLAVFTDPSGLFGYIDKQGKTVIKPQFSEAFQFKDGYAKVKMGKKYGYIDKSGKIVVDCIYDGGGEFYDGIAAVVIRKGGGYSTGVSVHGFVDTKGKQLTDIIYGEVSNFSNGYAWAGQRQGNQLKYALMDDKGKVLTDFKFENRNMPPEPPVVRDGYIIAQERNEDYSFNYILLDEKGNEVKEIRGLRNIITCDGPYDIAQRDDDGRYFYVDRNGNDVFSKTWYQAGEFSEGLAVVWNEYEGIAKVIDINGNEAFSSGYKWVGQFKEGLAPAEKDGKWGYIDATGKVIIDFRFESAQPFSEGVAMVRAGGKAGYIGKNGEYIIKPEYQAAEDCINGLIRVGTYPSDATLSSWEYWKYLDKSGKVFWEPENILIEKCRIVLPAGYDPNKKYPVVIGLPFTYGSAANLMSGYFGDFSNEKKWPEINREVMAKYYPDPGIRKNREIIMLITPGYGSPADHSWQGFTRAIERYNERVNNDLEELIRNYSVDTSRIILAGFSLGGDLSWALLNLNAGEFSGAIIMGSRCSYSKKGSIAKLAGIKARVYIAMGEHEEDVRIKGARQAKSLLDNAGVKNIFYTMPGKGHDSLGALEMRDALEFVLFY
ncbi:MAG: WG repeat-containing protein [Bacteroidota bacterium]